LLVFRHSTPLHFAAGYNRVAVVEFLLAHGADVHAKDKGCVLIKLSAIHQIYRSTHMMRQGLIFCFVHDLGDTDCKLIVLNTYFYICPFGMVVFTEYNFIAIKKLHA